MKIKEHLLSRKNSHMSSHSQKMTSDYKLHANSSPNLANHIIFENHNINVPIVTSNNIIENMNGKYIKLII